MSCQKKRNVSTEDKNAVLYNFNADNMIKRFKAGEKVIECEICQHSEERPEWLSRCRSLLLERCSIHSKSR